MIVVPLFPLDLVAFPYTPVPLHIFETRYKEMIGECLAASRPFGIVRAREEKMATIGCTVKIDEVLRRYDDGRMDIWCMGERRFELLNIEQGRSFLQANVEFIDDEAYEACKPEAGKAFLLHTELIRMLDADAQPPEPDSPHLAFDLAASLPEDLDFKQLILAMRSEKQRLEALIEYYQAMLPRLQKVMAGRKKAGSNGHVH